MGLGADTPLLVADEPGSWAVADGELLADAIDTALGKPGADMRVILIGTVAPSDGSGWWGQLVAGGSRGSTYVQALQGDPAKWDQWSEIRRCNPLVSVSARFRRKLLDERDEARTDTRLKARFQSYRLNVPTADESAVLLTVDDWARVEGRPVPLRAGRPVVGLDLGGGRSWSAAVAIWRSGRVEACAVAPGIPSLEAQAKRDRVPVATYRRLVEGGALSVVSGLRVQPPGALVDMIAPWRPGVIVCDRFRVAELQDAAGGRFRIVPRVVRWSEAAEDIRALRRMALDGPLSCEPGSRSLVAASLAVATVKTDDQGSVRLTKSGGRKPRPRRRSGGPGTRGRGALAGAATVPRATASLGPGAA